MCVHGQWPLKQSVDLFLAWILTAHPLNRQFVWIGLFIVLKRKKSNKKSLVLNITWTHIRQYCVELMLAKYYLFYLCREQFHQSHQFAWQKADCLKHHCTIEPMSWKNVSTLTVRRRLCETGLNGRIALKKLGSCGSRHTRNSSEIKFFGLTNQSSKSLGQVGGSMCDEELVKELQFPVSHQS